MKINEDGIDRDATAAEIVAIDDLAAELTAKQQQVENVLNAMKSKLAALGLSADEIKALVG